MIKQILAWIVFALNKSFFQLNPTELLALTCVGEDDRKIIEEVHFFIQMTTTMVLSVLKWINWRIKRSLVYSIDPHCTGRKQIGRESARKGGGGDTWSDVIRGGFNVFFNVCVSVCLFVYLFLPFGFCLFWRERMIWHHQRQVVLSRWTEHRSKASQIVIIICCCCSNCLPFKVEIVPPLEPAYYPISYYPIIFRWRLFHHWSPLIILYPIILLF